MNQSITCCLLKGDKELWNKNIQSLSDHPCVAKILPCHSFGSITMLRQIAAKTLTPYLLIYTKPQTLQWGEMALERMTDYLSAPGCGMVYADHYQYIDGAQQPHPVADYQPGSVRDDFDFGSVLLFKTNCFRKALDRIAQEPAYQYSALYALRLALSEETELTHIHEYLYTETEEDTRRSGEKQFDYVDPRNRQVQIERENVFTHYLKRTGAYLPPVESTVDLSEGDFEYEASVIIPVRNRVRTIEDAIRSVLAQETHFPFNLIIIDNHSTDGTSEAIERYKEDKRIVHLIPERMDLGIGGCWNYGVHHPLCGRFAVQLDSDDLYSSPNTLQCIIDKFYEEKCAMVIGTYRMTDFNLQTLPPGIIDHKEWTRENGHNNALRINGLGAPRAFFTPILRDIRVPNTSYGEDYALGLAFSRQYRIGRIYDVLYLCRRWEGNSDAALSIEKTNQNNTYKDSLRTLELKHRRAWVAAHHTTPGTDFLVRQLRTWKLARQNHQALKQIQTKTFQIDGNDIIVQFNPTRAVSTCAATDKASIAARPCFLCTAHKPQEQESISIWLDEEFSLRINPYPILKDHLTISTLRHQEQTLADKTERQLPGRLLDWIDNYFDKGYAVFYNGARCGASAPDHFHFQAVRKEDIPFIHQGDRLMKTALQTEEMKTNDGSLCRSYQINGYVCPLHAFITQEGKITPPALIEHYLHSLPVHQGESEPRYNLFAWTDEKRGFTVVYFPRDRHRPECYTAQKEKQLLVSPGALDMGGLIVTPRKEDFLKITEEDIRRIYGEVAHY